MLDRIDFAEAVAQQPDWMRKAASLAQAACDTRTITPWRPDETVAVVGMGSSTNAGTVFVEALRGVGQRAVNIDASAVANYPVGFCPADHVIVISESGRSPEPIAAVKRMGVVPIVITNDLESPVAQLSDFIVYLGGFADSGVYTIGYTTTLVALAVVAQAHGVPVDTGFGSDNSSPELMVGAAANILDNAATLATGNAKTLDKASFLDIVGQGVSLGSAQAAALLFRESCGLATAAHQTIQYLHGPMECCQPNGAVLIFGNGRESALAEQLRDAGITVIQYAHYAERYIDGHKELAGDFPSAVAEIVLAQVIAVELAKLRGRRVGQFRFEQLDTKLPVGG